MESKKPQIRRFGDFSIPWLFGLIALLQIVDLHSTLTASTTRDELNRLIVWISGFVGLPAAMVLFKLIDLAVVFSLFRIWRESEGRFNAPFLFLLSMLCITYTFVVVSNYVG